MGEEHLRVYASRSELVHPDGTAEVFLEGISSTETQHRYRKIQQAFNAGFLDQLILRCRNDVAPPDFNRLMEKDVQLLDKLVASITSEVGRALVCLVIMQLSIKTIEPGQSIRLHKGGRSKKDFSWCDGISMRSLDKHYVTPTLRKHGLVKLNADGFMMTRSLAENYPYSIVYKANVRGARTDWLLLVEDIEAGRIDTEQALLYLISQLINQAAAFEGLAHEVLNSLTYLLGETEPHVQNTVVRIITEHINRSGYAARVMEIAMHSLMQAIQDLNGFAGVELMPLSQMRSANKKHGNIADIELVKDGQVVEAWDAKFGKSYLRDELEELIDKLSNHPEARVVGFVTSGQPEHLDELESRMHDIEDLFSVQFKIISFDEWIRFQFQQVVLENEITENDLSVAWLQAYVESIAQRRRDIAPIDEPCHHWLELLGIILKTYLSR
ncbi:MAG: hypothetical protein JNM70_03285 [Anaerolineae bacterium]|nr:hypothetical protein [Anaerolineae bacterium]